MGIRYNKAVALSVLIKSKITKMGVIELSTYISLVNYSHHHTSVEVYVHRWFEEYGVCTANLVAIEPSRVRCLYCYPCY